CSSSDPADRPRLPRRPEVRRARPGAAKPGGRPRGRHAERGRRADRGHGDPLRVEVPAPPLREGGPTQVAPGDGGGRGLGDHTRALAPRGRHARPRHLRAVDGRVRHRLVLVGHAAHRDVPRGPAAAAMKPTAWLVNIARGAVVNEAALFEALEQRRLAGAILDVFSAEPLPPHHPLWRMDNVVITPHVSGPSTPEEIAPVFNDNLARYLAGSPLRHVVDRARGY